MDDYDKKEFGLLFTLLVIAITTGIIAVTYSLFFSSAKNNDSLKIARWVVKVNSKNVTESQDHTFTFDEFIFDDNPNVEENMFAPGVSVTLPITIDARESDVDVDYEIVVDEDYVPINKAIVLKNLPIRGTLTKSNGIININNVKLVWEDIEGNDEEDTSFALNNDSFKIPIKINLKQHVDKRS
ncbi:MAG: hypothetical protein IJI43_03210 [Bacilli bacterium]|nr:hypothetical protein [Bacilli bacterium]